MRVYTSKLTPDSVTCLFHDFKRSLWLFCSVQKYTIHHDWQLGCQFCTCAQCLKD